MFLKTGGGDEQKSRKLPIEGESRDMTVLFSDIRGFTTISEGLQPKELTKLMNEYMTPMTYVIQKHRGTIDKYIGDAIMAFWAHRCMMMSMRATPS